MANQNEQQPGETARDSTMDGAVTPAPVLRRRQPTVIPKLQGRRPAAASPAAPPVSPPPVSPPAKDDPAKDYPAKDEPPVPVRRPARKQLLWVSAAAGLIAVMIATGVVLGNRHNEAAGDASVALPAPTIPDFSVPPAEQGVGAITTPSSSPPVSGGPSDTAPAGATHSAPAGKKPTATATGLPNPSGVDLALRRPVTVSGVEGSAWVASYAVDGDLTTRWSSAWTDTEWIKIDLGALRQISRVELAWERSYAAAFQLQTSADGKTWKSVYGTTSSPGGTQTIKTTGAVGRYLRIYCTRRVSEYGYSLFEIDVR